MAWSYGLGRYNGKIKLCEVTVTDDDLWGHAIGWSELLKHPIMVIGDIMSQYIELDIMFDINKLERRMKKFFKKIIKGINDGRE